MTACDNQSTSLNTAQREFRDKTKLTLLKTLFVLQHNPLWAIAQLECALSNQTICRQTHRLKIAIHLTSHRAFSRKQSHWQVTCRVCYNEHSTLRMHGVLRVCSHEAPRALRSVPASRFLLYTRTLASLPAAPWPEAIGRV